MSRRQSTLARLLRGAGSRIVRLLGGGRVLQVSEVTTAITEQLEMDALRGLRLRYLPSRVEVAVSRADHEMLRPFVPSVCRALEEHTRRLDDTGAWRSTAGSIEVLLETDRLLGRGAPPGVRFSYGDGARAASWYPPAPRDSADGLPAAVPGGGSTAQSAPLRLQLVASLGGGTSLQEEVVVVLEEEIPLTQAIGGGAAAGVLRLDPEEGLVDAAHGAPWAPPEGLEVQVVPPPPGLRPLRLCPGFDHPTVVLRRPGASTDLIWHPGGALVLGRSESACHLVPGHAPPGLSRAHLALCRTGRGRLEVCDLGSSNGTWLDGQRLPPNQPEPLGPPATIVVGSEARLVVKVEWEDSD